MFFNSSKHFVGIDLGTHSIKIAMVKPSSKKFNLLRCAVIPYGPDIPADAPLLDRRDIAAQLIKDYLRNASLSTKFAATSVSGNSVIVRFVKIEKMSSIELTNSLAFQAEPYIPFNIDEVNLSFAILGDIMEEGRPQMETVLVAAKRESVDIRVDILRDAGLRPKVVDIDAFALENMFEIAQPPANESVLVLNVGANTTNLVIFENGVSRVVRDINIAGNNFTKAIVQQFQCETMVAEQKKIANGLASDPNDAESQQISDALISVGRDLATEVQRSIDFYVSQGHERTVQRILLCGGSANLRLFDQFLSGELSLPVEVLNPLGAFSQLPKELAENPAIGPQMALAIGLALRKEGDML